MKFIFITFLLAPFSTFASPPNCIAMMGPDYKYDAESGDCVLRTGPSYPACLEFKKTDAYIRTRDDAFYIQKKLMTDNIKETCDQLGTREMPRSLRVKKKIDAGIEVPFEDENWLHGLPEASTSAWAYSVPKNLETRMYYYQKGYFLADDELNISDIKNVLDGKKHLNPVNNMDNAKYLRELSKDKEKSSTQFISNKAVSSLATNGLCIAAKNGLPGKCGEGLSKVVDWMKADDISLPEVMLKALTDKKFEKGIVAAAKKMISMVEQKKTGENHFFDDLYQSFKENGCTDAEAKKNAWDAVGLIATAGPNLSNRLQQLVGRTTSDKSIAALSAISRATPVLDLLSENGETGRYSYPKGMKFSCDNGKNYHFWLTAYFAHRLTDEEGLSRKDAAYAAFTAEKAYQMLYVTATRDPNDIFEKDAFDKRLNSMRLDMVLGSTGALYGSTGEVASVDQGMIHMLNSSIPATKDSSLNWHGSPVSSYIYFDKVMAPDSVMRNFFPN
ncbi:hypothetical protein DOM22_11100 [Bdellovibrio sp. ZAP7]|uniref:hypothetical protein n=1 Tax=Bdellovibrio sp. ZAP7 TaxID=2231053 RepID=UPI0011579E51|nr:hypothetical protein [Bdellovibrio sp. ZAP7]QDK45655.1 hypothetical protein DOM22_11100 [Bdellovibrio sp. ZAP7]